MMKIEQTLSTIRWFNVMVLTFLHLFAFHGIYHILTLKLALPTLFWFVFMLFGTLQGMTSGAHRLWCHRSYKARFPLRLVLAFFQTMTFQFSILKWSRDHRVHHKYSDTDADPHNASRGFFFSHVGWYITKAHPEFKKRIKEMDCSDLLADPIVYYQNKYYIPLVVFLTFVFPTVVPWYFWKENPYVAFTTCAALKLMLVSHFTFLINSAAHMWGNKPYDRNIKPAENWVVSLLILGEGWHNYHHTFPWDYKAEELGRYSLNLSTAFIDLMAKVGLAYDLKTASREVVDGRRQRTGKIRVGEK